MFTEEEDAYENGWIAVIHRIIQHHCVTKMIGFDVIYGDSCSYGYSATRAIFDKCCSYGYSATRAIFDK